jgi:hypothetical protein
MNINDGFFSMNVFSVATCDLNNDENMDIIVTSNDVYVLLGNGDGTFQDAVYYYAGRSPKVLALEDINRDGKIDLVVGSYPAHNLYILLGNGDGTFQAGEYFSPGDGPAYSVCIGDFTADGNLDIAIANGWTNSFSILFGYGDGSFTDNYNYKPKHNSYFLINNDLNNDGLLDLVLTNAFTNEEDISVFIQDTSEVMIQAEDYNEGGQYIAYYDKTPGNKGGQYRDDDVDIWRYGANTFYTGANATGEWLKYTVDIPSNGDYLLNIRLATPYQDRRLHFESDGVDLTGCISLMNTSAWTNWQTQSTNVSLNAGQQEFRLFVETGGFNIDQISLKFLGQIERVATPTIEPSGGNFVDFAEVTLSTETPDAIIYYTTNGKVSSIYSNIYTEPFIIRQDADIIARATKDGLPYSWDASAEFKIKDQGSVGPISIQAEDYDKGGQLVAYLDTTPTNTGGQYRDDDVDIWKYGINTYYTGANATGEWLNYTVDVPYSGNYRVELRVATPKDGRQLRIKFDDVDMTGLLPVPNTGWWTTWQTTSCELHLDAGLQVMRLVIENGGLNIDQISLVFLGN